MNIWCREPLSYEALVAYWAGDVTSDERDRVEEHVMGCSACAASAARIGAIAEAVRATLPPLLSQEAVDRLRARGVRVLENRMAPGDQREVLFPRDVDLLVHRLQGLELAQAARVSLAIRAESNGRVLVSTDDDVSDRARGELLVACEPYYASLPHEVVVEVRVRSEDGVEKLARYAIRHRFAPR